MLAVQINEIFITV